ncbi:MAG: response regulator transcription factor [Flavobacteriales bacterium]|nr:Sensory transduction protein regX3 [Flavobacteriales bacterium]MCC6577274.1 response regulator transcription factor [Flavobacteriales bacterium]NUQ13716.1 response regulator transcription factor [Flavobacteriales bacterium]
MKILVVEDEAGLADVITRSLEREHYVVELARDHRSALLKIADHAYDVILLDIMLPGGSGLDVLRALKQQGTPGNVIIISAKDSLEDKLTGLDLGADDYLTKPFHLAELNARVRSVLRRKALGGGNGISAGNLRMDVDGRSVQVDGAEVALNRKEFDTLQHLLLNKDRLVTRGALAEHVWGDHADGGDDLDFIYSQIKNLRRKLKQAGATLEIQAVYGIGYKLVEP